MCLHRAVARNLHMNLNCCLFGKSMAVTRQNKEAYPKDWAARRQALLQRSGGTCERCGIAAGTPTGKRQLPVVLQAAHMKPGDHRLANIRLLCRSCHLAVDIDQHLFNRRVNRARKQAAGQRDLFGEER